MPDVAFGAAEDTRGPVIELQLGEGLGQYIEGFGGAFTEASATVFDGLSVYEQKKVVETYWGPEGLGYTLGRVHINSCDFATHPYSFDDVDGDWDLEHFDDDVTRDASALIPFVTAAQDALQAQDKRLKLLASPWSPPAWMKQNGGVLHSSQTCLREQAQTTWARYFTRWIDAYQKRGVDIWAITIQNEPENNATWEACLYTPEQEVAFLANYLGPAMQQAHPQVKIFIFDHNKDHVYAWAKELYKHPEAYRYAAGVAFHWYAGDHFDQVRRVWDKFPQAVLLPSEATYEKWRWHEGVKLEEGDWSFGEGYAHDIIGNLNAGSVGWIDWNLILDAEGGPNHVQNSCDAAMMVKRGGEVVFHPQLHFISHFSKHVPLGSRHVRAVVSNTRTYREENRNYGTCGDDDGLEASAFLRPDGQAVVVVLNCGHDAVRFQLCDHGEALPGVIPGHAIQTYLFDMATVQPAQHDLTQGEAV